MFPKTRVIVPVNTVQIVPEDTTDPQGPVDNLMQKWTKRKFVECFYRNVPDNTKRRLSLIL